MKTYISQPSSPVKIKQNANENLAKYFKHITNHKMQHFLKTESNTQNTDQGFSEKFQKTKDLISLENNVRTLVNSESLSKLNFNGKEKLRRTSNLEPSNSINILLQSNSSSNPVKSKAKSPPINTPSHMDTVSKFMSQYDELLKVIKKGSKKKKIKTRQNKIKVQQLNKEISFIGSKEDLLTTPSDLKNYNKKYERIYLKEVIQGTKNSLRSDSICEINTKGSLTNRLERIKYKSIF